MCLAAFLVTTTERCHYLLQLSLFVKFISTNYKNENLCLFVPSTEGESNNLTKIFLFLFNKQNIYIYNFICFIDLFIYMKIVTVSFTFQK